MPTSTSSPLGEMIRIACLMEAAAPKPGNVHPDASFADMTYADLVASASAIAPVLAEAPGQGLGATILDAVVATREVVACNTNLGIILLLAPLAAVPTERSLEEGVAEVLEGLTSQDARQVYQAIRLAGPGGLGHVPQEDVSGPPGDSLMAAMQLAAHRDAVAGCYVDRFQRVLSWSRNWLPSAEEFVADWSDHVVGLSLRVLAQQTDSLIKRKCGTTVAAEASRRARQVLDCGWPAQPESVVTLATFDTWLRADGHQRNPGTTADLITAILFAALRERRLTAPPLESLPVTSTP